MNPAPEFRNPSMYSKSGVTTNMKTAVWLGRMCMVLELYVTKEKGEVTRNELDDVSSQVLMS
jgi:hypothetical protein